MRPFTLTPCRVTRAGHVVLDIEIQIVERDVQLDGAIPWKAAQFDLEGRHEVSHRGREYFTHFDASANDVQQG